MSLRYNRNADSKKLRENPKKTLKGHNKSTKNICAIPVRPISTPLEAKLKKRWEQKIKASKKRKNQLIRNLLKGLE